MQQEVVNMFPKMIEILVLCPDKLIAQEFTGMLPCGTLLSEDALTKKWREDL